MTAADTLKTLRLRAGFTQQQLADKAGIDRSWYNQMERGNRPITRAPAERLAEVLEVNPVEFGIESPAALPEYRSLLDRLEELEAIFAEERRKHERALRAVTRRLADLEEGRETRARQGVRRPSGQQR